MAFKRKKIVSAIVASLIAVTPNLCAGERNKDITYKKDSRSNILTYMMCGTLFTVGGIASAKMVHDSCKNDYNVYGDYDNESFSNNNQDDNKNKEPMIFIGDYYKNTPDKPSQYVIDNARLSYQKEHPEDIDKVNDYIERFTCCYRAAAIWYGLDQLGKDSFDNESMTLRSIVDDILTIPGIECIYVRPQRQILFYLFSKFKGNFEDVVKWVNVTKETRPEFFQGVKFPFLALNLAGIPLIDDRWKGMKHLKDTMIKIEESGDGWSFVSEECFGSAEFNDCMKLTIEPDNRKTLHYVYNSPSVRRCCELEYKF